MFEGTSSAQVAATAHGLPASSDEQSQAIAPAYRLAATIYRDRRTLVEALEQLHKPSGVFVRAADDVPVSAVATGIQAARDAGFDQVTYVPAS